MPLRWKTIQIQNAIFILGAIIIAAAQDVNGVYVGRFIVGIASALSAIADIPYLTEVSAPEYRGRLTSAYEMLVVIGIFFSFIMNLALSTADGGWRWMFGIPAIFAGVQSCLMISLPESPKWLLENGHSEQARAVLGESIDDESQINLIIEEFQSQAGSRLVELPNFSESKLSIHPLSSSSEESKSFQTAERTFRDFRAAFICILLLMFFQQFTGGVVLRNYATEIFQDAGVSSRNSLIFTVVLGLVKVIVSFWAIYKVWC